MRSVGAFLLDDHNLRGGDVARPQLQRLLASVHHGLLNAKGERWRPDTPEEGRERGRRSDDALRREITSVGVV